MTSLGRAVLEASPSPVYGARLLSGLRSDPPLAGSNPAASAPVRRLLSGGTGEEPSNLCEPPGLHKSAMHKVDPTQRCHGRVAPRRMGRATAPHGVGQRIEGGETMKIVQKVAIVVAATLMGIGLLGSPASADSSWGGCCASAID